ncbi:hypothetical protein DFH06DRAFT_1467204, partial [Mycena polygramma]
MNSRSPSTIPNIGVMSPPDVSMSDKGTNSDCRVSLAILRTNTTQAAAKWAAVPGAGDVLQIISNILETVQKVNQNRDDLRALCHKIQQIFGILDQQLSHRQMSVPTGLTIFGELQSLLKLVLVTVEGLQIQIHTNRQANRQAVKANNTTEEIIEHQKKLDHIYAKLVVFTTADTTRKLDDSHTMVPVTQGISTPIDTNLKVHKNHTAMSPSTGPTIPAPVTSASTMSTYGLLASPNTGAISHDRSPSQAPFKWLGPSLLVSNTFAAVGTVVPVLGVGDIFKTISSILEAIEKAKKNSEDLKELRQSIERIKPILQKQWSDYGDTAAVWLKDECEHLEHVLKAALQAVVKLQKESQSVRGRLKHLANVSSIKDEIARHENRIQVLCTTISMSASLHTAPKVDQIQAITTHTSSKVDQMHAHTSSKLDQIHAAILSLLTGYSAQPDLAGMLAKLQGIGNINSHSSPSRVFHNKQAILDKVKEVEEPCVLG